MRSIYPILIATLLTACAAPSDGPSPSSFYSAKDPSTGEDVRVIRLSQDSINVQTPLQTAFASSPGLSVFKTSGYSDERLRRGDVIEVTVFDTGEEGLLSSAGSQTVNLGRFTVDSAGTVSLPFVGKQRVLESSPEALQNRIVSGLKGSAVNPQAVVTVVERPGNGMTVGGLVRSPGRIALSARKERVSDVVAMAGGASAPAGTVLVTLSRGSQKASAPLERVLNDPAQNVHLLPDDQLYLEDIAPSVTVMGAFKSTGEFRFEPGKLTLAQALGRAGGLLDDRANARQVYVLRSLPVHTPVRTSDGKVLPGTSTVQIKPVIYRADLKDISNLALMQQFQVMDGDIVYASNAGMVDFAKLFTIYQKSPNLPAAAPPAAPGF